MRHHRPHPPQSSISATGDGRLFVVLVVVAFVLAVLLLASSAGAAPRPSSDLLLPWFEVDLSSPQGRTTTFAVGNAAREPVRVQARVHSSWGVPVLTSTFTLEAGAVQTVNLRSWLEAGTLPERELGARQIEHVQAALCGERSPVDGLFYSGAFDREPGARLATGWVTFRVASSPRQDSLWGDFFWIDPSQDYAEGELLVDIDSTSECSALCDRHLLRFLDGGAFDGGTELVVWTGEIGQASAEARSTAPAVTLVASGSAAYREDGVHSADRFFDVAPVEVIDVSTLELGEPFGWLDLVTETPVWIGVRYKADNRFGVSMASWCLEDDPEPRCPGADCGEEPPEDPPEDPPECQGAECDEEPPADPDDPAIDLEKATNGIDGDHLDGPTVAPGSTVTWTYVVTNTGNVTLTGVAVGDDREGAIACPATRLAPGASMTCTHRGTATQGTYVNLGTVTGTAPDGTVVSDQDPSSYLTPAIETVSVSIDVEKATNGEDADTGPGPEIEVGSAVTWTYVVTNTGEGPLASITLVDDVEGTIACPATQLAPGASMTCTHQGVAVLGPYANTATVRGTGGDGAVVQDTDPSHYLGVEAPEPPEPCGTCEGKISRLTLRWLGADSALVTVTAKRGPTTDVVFSGTVAPGGVFELIGPASGNGGFANTLGTEIRLAVDGADEATLHTSCSVPVGPGTVAGRFVVEAGASTGGGALCPAG